MIKFVLLHEIVCAGWKIYCSDWDLELSVGLSEFDLSSILDRDLKIWNSFPVYHDSFLSDLPEPLLNIELKTYALTSV